MYLRTETKNKAFAITSLFEGWLAGNFDGQGMSYGFLQWNFGQGTLQPLFLRLFSEFPYICRTLPENGLSLINAIENGTAVEWSLGIQQDNQIIDPWYSALKELYGTEAWQQIMYDAAEEYINIAIRMCTAFDMRTDRAFAMAFDIAVQNGGLGYYEMAENDLEDKLQSWIEVAVGRTTGKINGSVELCKEDVRNRKSAIKLCGPYGTKGWPDGIIFDNEDAFMPQQQEAVEEPTNSWIDWNTILELVAEDPEAWRHGIAGLTNIAGEDTNLGDLEIFQFLPLLIEKMFNFRKSIKLSWEEVISNVVNNCDDWVKGVHAIVAMSEADNNLGEIEIFRWLPELIVKIYSY